jgi:hypothetical protein
MPFVQEIINSEKLVASKKCTAYTFQPGGGYKSCLLIFGSMEVDSAEENVVSGQAECQPSAEDP